MILVIDDVKSFPFQVPVTYARTLADGARFLVEYETLDELWLDHDLGGEDTIRPLVLALAERAFNGNPKQINRVVICSLNPPGADWIESTLNKWYAVERCQTPAQVRNRLGTVEGLKWY